MANWNPIRAYEDSKKRQAMKANLLQLCRLKLHRNSDMLQLGNASIDSKFQDQGREAAQMAGRWTQILEEFCREHPEYSLVLWSGVPALCLTRGVDALPQDLREKNMAEGFIIKGGKF